MSREKPVEAKVTLKKTSSKGKIVRMWVVKRCPYCGAKHEHSAGAGDMDPKERLGTTHFAHCGNGEYVLVEPE